MSGAPDKLDWTTKLMFLLIPSVAHIPKNMHLTDFRDGGLLDSEYRHILLHEKVAMTEIVHQLFTPPPFFTIHVDRAKEPWTNLIHG